jgi:hypothetical protein
MNPKTIFRIQDALAKLDAKSKLVSGGDQYTSEVSLAVAGLNKGKALLRNQKLEGAQTLPLRELQARSKK